MNSNKYILFLFILVLSIIFGYFCLKLVDMAFQISVQPIKALFMRIIIFIMFILPIILRRKEIFIYYFLISFPFMQFMNKTLSLITLYAIILVILYWSEIFNLIRKNFIIYKYPFLGFLICFIYTTLLAKYPGQALEKVIFYLSLGGVFLALTAYLNIGKGINTFLKIFLGIYIFCCLISFWQLFFGINSIKFSFSSYNPNTAIYGFANVKKIPSIFNETQGAGQYFAIMSILSLGILRFIFRKPILGILAFLLGGIALMLTVSRLAILSFFIGLILVMLFPFSLKRFFGVLVITVSLIIGLFVSYSHIIPSHFKERFDAYNLREGFQYRSKMWQDSLPIILNNPFGVGLGGYNRFEAGYVATSRFTKIGNRAIEYTHFESSYLSLLYSLGIIGFGFFIYLLIKYFSLGYIFLKKKNIFSLYLISPMLIWVMTSSASPQMEEVQPMIVFIELLIFMNMLKNYSFLMRTGQKQISSTFS